MLRLALVGLTILSAAQSCLGSQQPWTTYKNPILPGFNPDPSCIRVDSDFFCATSTFNFFPGIPIYTSKDLVHWTHLGHVLSRPEQLPQVAALNGSTSGIWAPGLRFHDGTFYVSTTLVHDKLDANDSGKFDNMVFFTKDIFSGTWSDPVHLTPAFLGYDASLFWDTDGTTYVQLSHNWPVAVGIWSYVIDLKTGNITQGEVLWNGTGGEAPEGPHIYLKDDWYYLLIAEGGTGLNHMVTMARSRSIHGPYEPYANNPVYTNANTTNYLQDVGHADLFTDTEGNWWACSLAVRNATVNFPIGRETSLVPVIWNAGEFPVFDPLDPGRDAVTMSGPLPPVHLQISDVNQAYIKHTFAPHSQIPYEFIFWRLPNTSSYEISAPSHPNTLLLHGSAQNLTGNALTGTSTFISRRQQHLEFTTTVNLEFAPQFVGEEAGITVFLNPALHFDLGVVSLEQGTRHIRLRTFTVNSTIGDSDPISAPGMFQLPNLKDKLSLRVQAVNASIYEFSYATFGHGGGWNTIGYGAARQISGGFTGTVVGIYATGNGNISTAPAYFSDFVYSGVEGVY